MVGIAEVSAAMASLQAGKDMVAALVGIRDGAKLNEVRIGLQGVILEAQQGLFAAQQAHATSDARIAKLEEEIVRLKDWSSEQQRYELVGAGSGGAFVYMQKEGMRTSEPAHWLCANCFGNGKKSILQGSRPYNNPTKTWTCPACKTTFLTPYQRVPEYAAAA